MHISYRKKINRWAISYNHREHNHPMNPGPYFFTSSIEIANLAMTKQCVSMRASGRIVL